MTALAASLPLLRAIPNPVDEQGRVLDKSAAGILERRFERLRFDLLLEKEQRAKLLKTDIAGYLDGVAQRIAAQIEGSDATRTEEQGRLAQELTKAQRMLAGAAGTEGDGPNPNGPYRRLLWAIANELAEHHAGAEQYRANCEALANSRAMRQMLEQFRMRVGEGLFQVEGGTSVQYGPPGSWFFQANSPDRASSVINLDLRGSLYLGDYVDAVFEHELHHHEKSRHYPQAVEAERLRVIEARKGVGYLDARTVAKGSEAIPTAKRAAVEEYLEASYLLTLRHRLWNAIEDNMCNHGLADLSNPELKNPPYPFRLDYSINLTKTLIAGVGHYVTGALRHPEQYEEAADKLDAIGHAIDMGVFLHNGLASDTPEGWRSIGIDTGALRHKDHPEWGAEQTYRDLAARAVAIGQAQPLPSQRSRRDYLKLCEDACQARNILIDALFADYLEVDLARAAEEFRSKSLAEKIAELEKQILAAREGYASTGGRGGSPEALPILVDQAGGSCALPGMEMADNPNPGHDVPREPPEPVGASSNWDKLERDAMNARDPDGPINAPPVRKAGMPNQPFKPNHSPGGAALSAIGKLNLTDGRTLAELRDDPLYEAAVEEIADQLRAISRRCPSVTVAHEEMGSLWEPPEGNLDALDDEKLHHTADRIAAGTAHRDDYYLYRDDCTATIEAPGDLVIDIDFSGSMGSGAGSPLDAAVKGAALIYDAGRRADFGVYVKVWGNEHPTILATPSMAVEIADGQIDRAYRAGVLGEQVEGLHAGTEVMGTYGDTFARLSLDGNGRAPGSLRGPVHGLTLSDGGIYGEESQILRLDTSLRAVPEYTMDCALTGGIGSSLHAVLERDARNLPGYQQPICFPIRSVQDVFPAMVDWVVQRHDQFVGMIEANPRWNLTQAKLQQKMGTALQHFCHQHGCDEAELLHFAETHQGLPDARPGKKIKGRLHAETNEQISM